jgi:hypothetical protein
LCLASPCARWVVLLFGSPAAAGGGPRAPRGQRARAPPTPTPTPTPTPDAATATQRLYGRCETQNPKTHHLVLDQRMFLWASYVLGQDIDEVWWPSGQRIWLADINEGRSAEKTALVRRIASKWPNMTIDSKPPAEGYGDRSAGMPGNQRRDPLGKRFRLPPAYVSTERGRKGLTRCFLLPT